MDKRHDTVLETLMEQLIEGGAENMGLVFAGYSTWPCRSSVAVSWRPALRARPSRQRYAKATRPSASIRPRVQSRSRAQNGRHDAEPFYPQSLDGDPVDPRCDAGCGRDVRQRRVHPRGRGGDASSDREPILLAGQPRAKLIDDELEACATGLSAINTSSSTLVTRDAPRRHCPRCRCALSHRHRPDDADAFSACPSHCQRPRCTGAPFSTSRAVASRRRICRLNDHAGLRAARKAVLR